MAVNADMVGLITAFQEDIRAIQSNMEKGILPNVEAGLTLWAEFNGKLTAEYAPLAAAYQEMAGAGMPHVPELIAALMEVVRLADVIADADPDIFPTRSADLAAAQVAQVAAESEPDVAD